MIETRVGSCFVLAHFSTFIQFPKTIAARPSTFSASARGRDKSGVYVAVAPGMYAREPRKWNQVCVFVHPVGGGGEGSAARGSFAGRRTNTFRSI